MTGGRIVGTIGAMTEGTIDGTIDGMIGEMTANAGGTAPTATTATTRARAGRW